MIAHAAASSPFLPRTPRRRPAVSPRDRHRQSCTLRAIDWRICSSSGTGLRIALRPTDEAKSTLSAYSEAAFSYYGRATAWVP